MSLLLGAVQIEITPELPIQLAGFSHRKSKAEEIHSPLYLKTYYFEHNGKSFVFFIGDLIWWDTKMASKWRREIEKQFNIPVSHIHFHATHNHSGPQTSDSFTSLLGVINKTFIFSLEEKIYESVKRARENKEHVSIRKRYTTSDISVNRRKQEGKKVVMQPNADAFVDRKVTLITFEKANGDIKGIWIHYACHPTSTDANVVSSEYPGYCCSLLQKRYEHAVIGFMQGCSGDVRPALIQDGRFYRGSLLDMERIGRKIGEDVLFALENQEGEKLDVDQMHTKVTYVPLFFQNRYDVIPNMNIYPDVLDIWEEHVKRHWKNENVILLEIRFFQIGSKLSVIGFSGEMVQQYAQLVKKLKPEALAIGYSNGMIGYVPSAKQIREGGYESEDFIYYFGLPAPFRIDIEEKIQIAIQNIVEGDQN